MNLLASSSIPPQLPVNPKTSIGLCATCLATLMNRVSSMRKGLSEKGSRRIETEAMMMAICQSGLS